MPEGFITFTAKKAELTDPDSGARHTISPHFLSPSTADGDAASTIASTRRVTGMLLMEYATPGSIGQDAFQRELDTLVDYLAKGGVPTDQNRQFAMGVFQKATGNALAIVTEPDKAEHAAEREESLKAAQRVGYGRPAGGMVQGCASGVCVTPAVIRR